MAYIPIIITFFMNDWLSVQIENFYTIKDISYFKSCIYLE